MGHISANKEKEMPHLSPFKIRWIHQQKRSPSAEQSELLVDSDVEIALEEVQRSNCRK
jgi:hypothetical protein